MLLLDKLWQRNGIGVRSWRLKRVFTRGSRHSNVTSCTACCNKRLFKHRHQITIYRRCCTCLYAVLTLLRTGSIFRTGMKQRTRFIAIHSVSVKFGHDMCNALGGMHALTGCDSTSAFVSKGKMLVFDLVKKTSKYKEAMCHLGQEFKPSEELHAARL